MSQTKSQLIGNVSGGAVFSGNVGIGTTTSPTTALDVNGDVTITDKIIHGGDTNTAIRFPATDTVSIETAGGERLRIDSSGRVGIGTSSPTQLLQVGGVTTPTVSATPTAIRLDNTFTGSPATNQKLKFYLYNDGSEAYGITTGDAADFQYWAGGSSTGIHRWFTSNTERMRIDSSGNMGIGTSATEAGYKTTISGNGGAIWAVDTNPSNTGSRILSVWRTGTFDSSDTSSHFLLFQRPDGTTCGAISRNGTTSVNYNTSSDYRLKENVAPVPDGITRLQQLKPIRFNFIAEPDRNVDGFLAHEVQDIVPESINGTKDAVDDDDNPIYQGIDQSKLVPLLTAALQEAIAKIEVLESKVAALEGS
jgi:hypothetical protein